MREPELTNLIEASRSGDSSARQHLIPLVYDELYRIARSQMNRENAGHTLQATALVHEAYIKIAGRNLKPLNRTHFLALSAQAMRQILIDHARKKRSDKRGGDWHKVTLSDWTSKASESELELIELNDAMEKLARFDQRAAKAVELMFFGGLTYEEIAEALGVGRSTVFEDIKAAKAWLAVEMTSG